MASVAMGEPMLYLFERLSDGPVGVVPEQVNLADLVRDQVQRLVWCDAAALRGGGYEVLNPGLPSPVEIDHADRLDMRAFARRIAELIADQEPRLTDVRVTIESSGPVAGPLHVVVTAVLTQLRDEPPLRFGIEYPMQ